MTIILQTLLLTATIFCICDANLSIYPRESEVREVRLLDGVWNFRIIPIEDDQNIGFTQKWYSQPLENSGAVIPMPVPSSYNDITQSREIRDYAGWAWYDRTFFVTQRWQTDKRNVILRFGSVNYKAMVFINGVNVLNHTGGHLPFEADVTKELKFGVKNLVTVAVDNRLSPQTLPPGNVVFKNDTNLFPKGFYETTTSFDFFNYAGIHRSVFLYAVPNVYIDDITITTEVKDTTGVINYSFSRKNGGTEQAVVDVFDKNGKAVVSGTKGFSGSISIPNAQLWWPYLTNTVVGYQYTLRFTLVDGSNVIDSYYLKVGIRTVEVKQTSFLINGKAFYFRGFGKHEDANIRGKGLDLPILIKDFNLLKWVGANSFRTSHYPYSEELMDEADDQGFVVIDECPAVGLSAFNDVLLQQHYYQLSELIERDKNRPSVVMWSIANEPASHIADAQSYFQKVAAHTRSLDKRPITAAINRDYNNDLMAQYLDVLMINRYYAWYSDAGYPQVIQKHVTSDFEGWNKKFSKPIMVSEYGADTVPGLHMDPPYIFSEDYQTEFLIEYHRAFDKLISMGFFVGEHVWNFADFMTNEEIRRVIGNKKGVFTRERQPKAAARLLRCRYWKLANKLNDNSLDANMYCAHY